MRTAFAWVWAAVVVTGCFGGETGSATGGQGTAPPIQRGDWTFFGPQQGLSDDIQDVSADEGGNVYVAGGDALYVKTRADSTFLRFDAANAGLTANCNDLSEFENEAPAKPFYMCRVLAVAGAAPGKAIIGFDSFSVEPQKGATWTYSAGGADVVAFDPVARTLSRTRHAWFASPPHVICTKPVYGRTSTCDPNDYWWVVGRRMFTRIRRVVVNHDPSSPMYGDVWVGGQHATFAALLENAAARGLPDRTLGMGPQWADAKDTWEHHHPAEELSDGTFVNGEGWALSIDPRDGKPWGSNEYRTTYVDGYGASLANDDWWQGPWLDLWKDPAPGTYFTPADDQVRSMSHCPDGTLWIGSLAHGLARIDTDGVVRTTSLPGGEKRVSAVACDPTDHSIWIGLAEGGVLRLRSGGFERLDPAGLPQFTRNAVQSIQIDRWSSPRTVYFAFVPITDGSGRILVGGGVGAYAGP